MSLFDTLAVSATGLTSQALRMDIISENIANVNTTKTADGTAYKRKTVIFEEKDKVLPFNKYFDNAINDQKYGKGVRVSKVVTDKSDGNIVYDPNHPDADENGYVEMPNVNVVNEMVNMISASRSYEANITAMNSTKGMITKTLQISQ